MLTCGKPNQTSRLTCSVKIYAGDVENNVELEVDRGVSCSILSMDVARQCFKGVSYSPGNARLFGQNPPPEVAFTSSEKKQRIRGDRGF